MKDKNGIEIKEGDVCIMELVGAGKGEVCITNHEGELCIHEPMMGFYPIEHAEKRNDIILEVIC